MTTDQLYEAGMISNEEWVLIQEAERDNPALAAQMRLNAWYNFRINALEERVAQLERIKK